MSRQASGVQAGRDAAGVGGLRWRIARLQDENTALRDAQRRLEAEGERLRADNERLRAERERLRERNERLRAEVEALRRAAKRQAAPFSKGDLTPNPKRSGASPVRPPAPALTGANPSRSTRWFRWGCRHAAPPVVASWCWNG